MFQRILYGSLAILFLLGVFWADARIAGACAASTHQLARLMAQGNLVLLLALGVFVAAAGEMHRLLRAAGVQPFSRVTTLGIVAVLLSPWFASAGRFWLLGMEAELSPTEVTTVAFLAAFVALCLTTVVRGFPAGSLRDLSAGVLTLAYLGLLPAMGLQLRCAPDRPPGLGAWLLLAVVLVTKASDIGAYFVGSAIGRHKLVPEISPAKSVEGMVGGLLFSGAAAVGFAYWAVAQSAIEPRTAMAAWCELLVSKLGYPTWDVFLLKSFGIGLAVSAAAQFGDLLESCFKRDAGIKDTGNVMPRFGGVLDLVDSPVLALPIGWALLAVVLGVR